MVDERPLSAAELFDAIGTGYEDAFGRPPVVDRAAQELLRRLPPGARVLDVGSGTGKPAAADLTANGWRTRVWRSSTPTSRCSSPTRPEHRRRSTC